MLEELDDFSKRLKELRRGVKKLATDRVNKQTVRDEAKALGGKWHVEYASVLKSILDASRLAHYNDCFTRLIKLSSPNNRVSSYLSVLDEIIRPFGDELLIPAQTGELIPAKASEFDVFLPKEAASAEGDYLSEAVACAKHGFFRAAAVMGWSAGIDRIHRRVEQLGFQRFNTVSVNMAAQNAGRYKNFNKAQCIASLSELREVPDGVILWIIEGMTLIDSNQHLRLRACFDMRCHGAHPGDAPITPYNLLSFFSDMETIVLHNPIFELE